jgi:sugar phosphate isomerase/epimerase
MPMQEILKRVQVHVPFTLLHQTLLPTVLREGINPEISFSHNDLERFGKDDYRETAARLADRGLTVTFHAPFMDLRPGAIDPAIRQTTVDRLKRCFEMIPWFNPRSVVCHPSFDERYYVAASEAQWLDNSIETWRELLGYVAHADTVIALENVYEKTPHPLRPLFDAIDSPRLRFCFDTGHAHAFGSAPLAEWITGLADRLGQIHLHDNHGASDEHLPVGEGSFPFRDLIAMLRGKRLQPIFTLESHSDRDLRRMLENIRTLRLLEDL